MYKKGDIEFSKVPDARSEEESEWQLGPVFHLPHSCDWWVIGGPEQVKLMIKELKEKLAISS